MSIAVASAPCRRITVDQPERALDEALARSDKNNDRDEWLAFDFDCIEYWREERTAIALSVFYRCRFERGAVAIAVAVLPRERLDACWPLAQGDIEQWLAAQAIPLFALNQPIPLLPIDIPKPWGREIWYTGIERRGVARVGTSAGAVPLPWLLAVAPTRLLGTAREPILLKILDPLSEPVYGDLYFELHREKQEVYVVTAVDRGAWPDGRGAIRFGFSAARRESYRDDRLFLHDYLAAVAAYRTVRRQIDAQLDLIRARERVALDAPVFAATLQRWLDEIPVALRLEEERLRLAMESFTELLPLAVGDVVKVPCFFPHSLQHGVRTVEFQTPVYERLILSFAQKVLTQDDWDTAAAAELLQMDPPPPAPFPVLAQGEDWLEERIVAFDEFAVRRITLQAGTTAVVELAGTYSLGMIVGAPLEVGGRRFAPDDAMLLPGAGGSLALRNPGGEAAYFLLAAPST